MQLRLSSLVDLALGQTHYLECENSTLLHTVLQVLLKKTSLSDTQVELTDDLAVKAANMIKMIPAEPSIVFKEYTIRDDGSKVRKRSSREICAKRSLTQVIKRWPKCCPSTSDKPNPSPTVTPQQSRVADQKVEVNEDDPKTLDDSFKATVTGRVESLERDFKRLSEQAEKRTQENCEALEDFKKLQTEFSRAKPALEQLQLQNLDEPLNRNQMTSQNIQNSQGNCDEVSLDNLSGWTVSTEEEDGEVLKEITWLKERVGEISESLRVQRKCLRSMKCDDFKWVRNNLEKIALDLQTVQYQVFEGQELLKAVRCHDLASLHQEIEGIKSGSCKLQSNLHEIATEMKVAKEEVCEQMSSLKSGIESQIKETKFSSSSSSNNVSEYSTKNLQASEVEVARSSTNCCLAPNCCTEVSKENKSRSDQCCMPNDGSRKESCCKNSSEDISHTNSSGRRLPGRKSEASYRQQKSLAVPSNSRSKYNRKKSSMYRPASDDTSCERRRHTMNPQDSESDNFSTQENDFKDQKQPIDISEMLNNIQKQLTSLNRCLQQIMGEIVQKVDQREFRMCRRQISEIFDLVMKLQNDIVCPSTTAGAAIPLMRNINCVSCKTTTNMKMSAGITIPKMPSLKYGRIASDATSDCTSRSQCRSISNRNWSSYSRSIGRRVGGSHTNVSKAMQVNKMRYKRLKTPLKIVSSIFIYKNRFRKASEYC